HPEVKTAKYPEFLCPRVGVTFFGEVLPASSRGRYSPFFAPADSCAKPIWLSLLRFFISFRESLQVAPSPCCQRVLPDSILQIFSRLQTFRYVQAFAFESAPRSLLPLRVSPQGSRDFYVRTYRALLPPHAPDMRSVTIQVIDTRRTFTFPDLQPCRLLR